MDQANSLEHAITEFLAASKAGQPFDQEAWLISHPQCAEDLRQFLKITNRIAAEAGRPCWAADVPTSGVCRIKNEPVDRNAATIDFRTQADAPLPAKPVGDEPNQELVRFGDYELLDEIGRGGMGVVYKARQLSLDRVVAIKMIVEGRFVTADDVERFHLEAQAAAKLEHPNIVVVHEVGVREGQHFFSMEYIEGQSLAALTRRGPLPPKQAARYVQQIAEAVQFAHQRGVLHRDIKPSNVLIDSAGNARVLDFGLAKYVDQEQRLTITGQILGTPTYMAPEQISNRRGEIGPACDIYGIGALLYELLTGRPPLKGRDQFETLLHVLDRAPPSPRHLNPDVPRELELICLKCLEKNPQHRYASAQHMADDVARYLAGDSISLIGPRLMDQLARTLERSQYDQEVHTWSRLLIQFAWVALLTHVFVYLNHVVSWPSRLNGLVTIRILEVVVLGCVLWILRHQWYPPRGVPARQLWSLGLGYMASSLVLLFTTFLLSPRGTVFEDFRVYPSLAVLTGLLFVVLGSSYWGYCYIIGAMFLLLAIVISFYLDVGPLLFGIAWAGSLIALGVRLRTLAKKEMTT